MEWTKLTSVSSSYEADLLAGKLRAEGFKARVSRSPEAPGGWLTSIGNQSGPFDVYVPADKAPAARKYLVPQGSSSHPSHTRSHHSTIRSVGRGLIAISLIAVVAAVLFEALR